MSAGLLSLLLQIFTYVCLISLACALARHPGALARHPGVGSVMPEFVVQQGRPL